MPHRLTILLLVAALSAPPAWALAPDDESPRRARPGGVTIEIHVDGEFNDRERPSHWTGEPPPDDRGAAIEAPADAESALAPPAAASTTSPAPGAEPTAAASTPPTPEPRAAAQPPPTLEPSAAAPAPSQAANPPSPVVPASPTRSVPLPDGFGEPATTDASRDGEEGVDPAQRDRHPPMRFTGLVHLSVRDVEEIADIRSADSPEHALRRLERSGLFATGAPRLTTDGVLEVTLTEYPWVRSVRIHGLTETAPDELLEVLFPVAPGDDAVTRRVARTERGRFVPGIAQGGLDGHLRRALQRLHDDGYRLASLTAALDRHGNLDLEVDEGRIGRISIEGVSDELAMRIRDLSALREGEIFLDSDVDQALDRVGDHYPSLRVVRGRRADRGHIEVDSTPTRDGTIHFRAHPEGAQAGDGYELRGRALVLRFRGSETPRGDFRFDGTELFRHTPVTNFAPGVAINVTVHEREDRARLVIDGGFNVNTGRDVARRVDGFAGARVQVPWLHLAEFGGQIYRLTDTQDRWRTSALDSYLSSMFFNAPGSEYFQRDGFTLLGGANVTDRLRLGVEYRRDLYRSLESLPKVFILFRGARYGAVNPAIDDGRMASAVIRLEYSSEPPEVRRPRTLIDRLSEQWLDHRARDRDRNSFNSVNTAELGTPALGTSDFEFFKLVSDSRAFLTTGKDQGVRLRFRAAGGRNLPLQKQESLGGWSALRGYDFKEFRGDLSLLGTLEYDWRMFSLFADLGSVKQGATWVEPRLSLGAALNLGDSFRIAAAWRTDERATATPAFHAVFQQPF